jgi:hypothetical protein
VIEEKKLINLLEKRSKMEGEKLAKFIDSLNVKLLNNVKHLT